ncbi:hypothetical protein [Ursidibacter sp. B-7004-1]
MSKYFGYIDDIDEFKYSSGAGKLGLLGKMALKTVANVGIFAVTELPKAVLNDAAQTNTATNQSYCKKCR